jgi:general secretion pathway protein C
MVFWGMRLFVRPDPVPLNAAVVGERATVRGDLSRLFGAEPVTQVAAAPAASSRFKLLGVMAAKPGPAGSVTPGVALISIDGKPARAFTAGARIEDKLVLQTVSLRTASVGVAQGPVSFVLEVPALPPPATGVLPRPNFESGAAPVPPAAPPSMAPAGVPPGMVSPGGAPPAGPASGQRPVRPGLGNPNTSR